MGMTRDVLHFLHLLQGYLRRSHDGRQTSGHRERCAAQEQPIIGQLRDQRQSLPDRRLNQSSQLVSVKKGKDVNMKKSVEVTLTAEAVAELRERSAKLGLGRSEMTGREREEFLAVRKEAGLKIDPKTAEVDWSYAGVGNPYGIFPGEPWCVGRAYFARSPGSDVWVEFGDLPEATRDALWKKHWRRIAFPAGLDALLTAPNPTSE